MKTTTNTTITNVRTAMQLSLSAVMLLTLAALPLGCTDENDAEGTDQVSSKTGALGEFDGEERSYRKHRKSGKHDRKDRMGCHKRGKRGGKHPDPAMTLFKAALKQDSLTAEQRQKIESLMADTKPGRDGARGESKKAFRASMAKAVRNGSIDPNVMVADFTKRRESRMAARSEMLNTLYATLDADQRQAVVADVKAHFDKKGEKFKGEQRRGDDSGKGFGNGKRGKRHGQKGERGMRNRSDGPRDGKGYHGKRGRREGRGGDIFRLIKGLELTEEQQTQIAELKQNRHANGADKEQRKARKAEIKQCRTSLLDSFAADNFDATAIRCQKGSIEARTAKMNQHVARISSLIGILTQEQRHQLADRLENPKRDRERNRSI